MKHLRRSGVWWLVLAAFLALLLTACGDLDSPASSCVEVDIDHPSSHRTKTSKPRTSAPKVKAPSYRKPSTPNRRR